MASANRPLPRLTLSIVAEGRAGDPATFVNTIEAALDRLAPPGVLGIAVSGGSDSLALLTIASDWAKERGRELRAVTVDHGLRAESGREAAFVADYAAHIGIAHRTLRAGELASGNLSAAAREARFGLIADWAEAGWAEAEGVTAIALGHSMDDQAETLLMRLARGAGVEGLASMQPRRDWRGIAWIRPMLAIRRAELRDWLRARDIAWIDDPTNEDRAFDRVKARHALSLLDPLGISVEGLARTAHLLARQRRVLRRAATELAERAVSWGSLGEAYITRAALARAELDSGLRVFGNTLARVAGREHRPRARALEPAFARLMGMPDAPEFRDAEDSLSARAEEIPAAGDDAGGAARMTLGGCLIVPEAEAGRLLICREPGAVAGRVPLIPGRNIWDRRWSVTASLGLNEGWQIGALGASGCNYLKHLATDGVWRPGEAWLQIARPVLETVAAIFPAFDAADDAAASACFPVAVPAAGFWAPDAPVCLREIRASVLAEERAPGDGTNGSARHR